MDWLQFLFSDTLFNFDDLQEQYTVCGGYEENSLNKSTCLNFSDGVWKQTSVLREERTAHVSWNLSENEGVLLIGGMRLIG